MNDPIYSTAMKWLTDHQPTVAVFVVLLVSGIWLAHSVDNFVDRIETTEKLTIDIANVQLPKMQNQMSDIRNEVRDMQRQNDEKFDELKSVLIRIDTYLATTSKDYPRK